MMRDIYGLVFNPSDDPTAWIKMLREAYIPERYWRATVDLIQPDGQDVLTWLNAASASMPKWLGEGQGFYLHGELNTGKSSAAAILAMDAIRRAQKVMWLSVRDVPYTRFREDDRAKAMNARLHAADLLVLDDLGAESFRLSGAAGTALEETFRIMYERDRSVIVTSNVAWSAFGGIYGEVMTSVVQRLMLPVEIKNPQWRVRR